MQKRHAFNEGSVRISQHRFIVEGLIFELPDIQSVELAVVKPRQLPAVAMLLLGVWLLQDEGPLFVLGGVAVVLGIAAAMAAAPKYAVILHTNAGVQRVLLSKDLAWIERVVQALDAAMIDRASSPANHVASAVHVSETELAPLVPPAVG